MGYAGEVRKGNAKVVKQLETVPDDSSSKYTNMSQHDYL